MIARNVTLKLRDANTFDQTVAEMVPGMERQPGFRQEISAVDGTDAWSVSVWDQQEHADAYDRDVWPGVLQQLTRMVAGTPQIRYAKVSKTV